MIKFLKWLRFIAVVAALACFSVAITHAEEEVPLVSTVKPVLCAPFAVIDKILTTEEGNVQVIFYKEGDEILGLVYFNKNKNVITIINVAKSGHACVVTGGHEVRIMAGDLFE